MEMTLIIPLTFGSEGQTETVSPSEETVQKEEDAPAESAETKQDEENQNEQGTVNASHMMSD